MLHQDRVAIVTGAAQGIGQACAERLAREGASVIVCDLDDAGGQAVADRLKADGGKARYVHADVGEKLDVRNLIAVTVEEFGRLDVLVNNAGIVDDAPFLELDVDEFDRILKTNLRGTFMCAKAAAKQMVAQLEEGGEDAKPGAIVNMSSINSFFGLPDHAAYATSKGGVMQLTRSMAVALAPHGIRVNAVGPGTIETPLIQDVVKDAAFRKKVLSRTPLGRFGQPEEIAAIVAWLASTEASYITGETIYADGGRLPLNYVMPAQDE